MSQSDFQDVLQHHPQLRNLNRPFAVTQTKNFKTNVACDWHLKLKFWNYQNRRHRICATTQWLHQGRRHSPQMQHELCQEGGQKMHRLFLRNRHDTRSTHVTNKQHEFTNGGPPWSNGNTCRGHLMQNAHAHHKHQMMVMARVAAVATTDVCGQTVEGPSWSATREIGAGFREPKALLRIWRRIWRVGEGRRWSGEALMVADRHRNCWNRRPNGLRRRPANRCRSPGQCRTPSSWRLRGAQWKAWRMSLWPGRGSNNAAAPSARAPRNCLTQTCTINCEEDDMNQNERTPHKHGQFEKKYWNPSNRLRTTYTTESKFGNPSRRNVIAALLNESPRSTQMTITSILDDWNSHVWIKLQLMLCYYVRWSIIWKSSIVELIRGPEARTRDFRLRVQHLNQGTMVAHLLGNVQKVCLCCTDNMNCGRQSRVRNARDSNPELWSGSAAPSFGHRPFRAGISGRLR